MIIEPISYAPDYVKKIASEQFPEAKAYAKFELFANSDSPILRNRTDELMPAVAAMAGDPMGKVLIVDFKGYELKSYGADIHGAANSSTCRFIFS